MPIELSRPAQPALKRLVAADVESHVPVHALVDLFMDATDVVPEADRI